MRLLLLADRLSELQRRVGFLAERLAPAGLVPVGVAQAPAAAGTMTAVPELAGRSATAAEAEPEPASRTGGLDAAAVFAELVARDAPEAVSLVGELLERARMCGFRAASRAGGDPVCYLRIDDGPLSYTALRIRLCGAVVVIDVQLGGNAPGGEASRIRQEFVGLLEAIPELAQYGGPVERRPGFDIMLLNQPAVQESFLAALAWFGDSLRPPTPTRHTARGLAERHPG